MRAISKIATWAIMSLTLSTTAVANTTAFGFKQHDYQQQVAQANLAKTKKELAIKRQLTCLARNVWYEAGAEPMKGQLAVAQVTVNRARSSRWPDDLCAVISQSKVTDQGQRVCQFSWYCDKTKNKNLPINESHPAYQAAYRVFVEGYRIASLGDNTFFFHNKDVEVEPSWPHHVIAQIGNHIFYKR